MNFVGFFWIKNGTKNAILTKWFVNFQSDLKISKNSVPMYENGDLGIAGSAPELVGSNFYRPFISLLSPGFEFGIEKEVESAQNVMFQRGTRGVPYFKCFTFHCTA